LEPHKFSNGTDSTNSYGTYALYNTIMVCIMPCIMLTSVSFINLFINACICLFHFIVQKLKGHINNNDHVAAIKEGLARIGKKSLKDSSDSDESDDQISEKVVADERRFSKAAKKLQKKVITELSKSSKGARMKRFLTGNTSNIVFERIQEVWSESKFFFIYLLCRRYVLWVYIGNLQVFPNAKLVHRL